MGLGFRQYHRKQMSARILSFCACLLSGTMAVLTCMQLVQAKDQQRERGLRLLLAAQERAAAAAASAESDKAAVAAAEAEMKPPPAAKVSFRPAKDVPATVSPVFYFRQVT